MINDSDAMVFVELAVGSVDLGHVIRMASSDWLKRCVYKTMCHVLRVNISSLCFQCFCLN